MDRLVVEVKTSIKIIGCTLWSDIPEEHSAEIQMRLNDFRKISFIAPDGRTAITCKEYGEWHIRERKWLEEQVQKAKENVIK
jgi:hypothetical protein